LFEKVLLPYAGLLNPPNLGDFEESFLEVPQIGGLGGECRNAGDFSNNLLNLFIIRKTGELNT
jgi:hypothetical protein